MLETFPKRKKIKKAKKKHLPIISKSRKPHFKVQKSPLKKKEKENVRDVPETKKNEKKTKKKILTDNFKVQKAHSKSKRLSLKVKKKRTLKTFSK